LQKHGRVKYIQHLSAGGPAARTSALPMRFAAKTTAVGAKRMDDGGGTLTWNTGDYHYDGSGNIDRIGPDDAENTRRYKYDELDRLVEAGLEAQGAAAGIYTNYSKYTYDSFGNRLTETTPSVNSTLTADTLTNHVSMNGTTISYDSVGNMTQGGGFSYKYDPFNNVEEIDGGGAIQKMSIYDANEERVIVCGDGSSGPCNWTLRGVQNEVLREYESGPITSSNPYYLWTEDDVYRGALIAGTQREEAEGGRRFFHLDHLGSPRLITNVDGRQIEKNEFAPFGRELASVTQEAQLGYDTEEHRFTGHERDFVEGVSDTANYVDYMHARTYTPALGRFLSVDPVWDVEKSLKAPQRWNRYTYSLNNPLNLLDPTGRNATIICDAQNKCSATVEAQIVANPNDPGQMAAARDFRNGALNYWQGTTINGPNGEVATVQMNISIIAPGQEVPGVDTLNVVTGGGTSNVQMTLIRGGQTESQPDTGTIYTRDTTNNPSGMAGIAAHEGGHLMGLPDLYAKGEAVPLNTSPTVDVMRHAQPTNSPLVGSWIFSPMNGDTIVIHLPPPCVLTGGC
jgi:RHS repeat-associated protein